MEGQHVNQAKRIEDYKRWSGAELVKDGQVVKAASDSDRPNEKIVTEELAFIRSLLRSSIKNIRCDISHKPTVEAIKSQLTEDERQCVKFGDDL